MKINVSSDITFKRNHKHLFSKIDGDIVMINIERGEYYNLDEVGGDIWNYLSVPHSFKDIINYLIDEYDVSSKECEKDVKPYLEELLSNNILLTNE